MVSSFFAGHNVYICLSVCVCTIQSSRCLSGLPFHWCSRCTIYSKIPAHPFICDMLLTMLQSQPRIRTFSALTLLAGRLEKNPAHKKFEWWGAGIVICLQQSANDLHTVQWCHSHPIISCFIKIQNGLTFLVPPYTWRSCFTISECV